MQDIMSFATTPVVDIARASDGIIPTPLNQGADRMAGSDTEIIQAVLQGDVDRFAELVDKYQGLVFRVALSFLGHHEDAKDASQEAFVSAYRSLRRFRGGATFSTWLYRIVVNECKDTFKRRSRQPAVAATVDQPDPRRDVDEGLFIDVDDPTANPSDQLANRELSQRLSQAIGALPMKQQRAFALHHLHGLTLEEVAGIMQCRVGTVKSHVFRATESLRMQLTPWLGMRESG
ncbi:MAG: RNA polymerase sigma factor [Candidatus Omnitrophica bacterium]|nr:RNA polymerase sigma factor [Candidatus Omnitrophota bacterium]